MINKNVFLVSLIFFAILSRFLPHPPNFTPIAAIALLSSKGFVNRWVAFLIPIVSLFISDLFLGLHTTIPFVYGSFILIALLGRYVKKINTEKTIGRPKPPFLIIEPKVAPTTNKKKMPKPKVYFSFKDVL